MNMNMRACSFFLGIWFISYSCLEAVLIRFDYIRTQDNKHVYIFFERHNPASRVDELQLEALSSALHTRDFRRMPQLNLMVEVPSFLTQIRAPEKKVTHNLIPSVRHCPSISAEDIEIRCVSFATEYMLGLSRQQVADGAFLQDRITAGTTWCCVSDITFQDLLSEFMLQATVIGDDLDRFCFIRPFYMPKCDKIRACEQELRRFLEKHSINTRERIADFIKRVSGLDSSFIKLGLTVILSDYSSHLFDINLMRKTLLSTCSYHMAVVGGAHARWFCDALEQVGAFRQESMSDEEGLHGDALKHIKEIVTTY
jgi:hypothetical protein